MESIMKMMGVNPEEINGQIGEMLQQFKKLCMMTEHNREMLVFLCEKLTPEETEKLQGRLDEVSRKYETSDN
jgi:hypothetical protein